VEDPVDSSAEPPTGGTSADESRSGADIAEAIEVAERDSSVQELHNRPEDTKAGEAPVEQTHGDPAMTEGQVVLGEGNDDEDAGLNPAEAGSGGAQSVVGARTSDRLAAGEPKPGGAPYDR
jgi:hypothetical protein